MEIIGGIVVMLGVAIFSLLAIFGSLAAAYESQERKRQMRAGTHDYYGNKLDE